MTWTPTLTLADAERYGCCEKGVKRFTRGLAELPVEVALAKRTQNRVYVLGVILMKYPRILKVCADRFGCTSRSSGTPTVIRWGASSLNHSYISARYQAEATAEHLFSGVGYRGTPDGWTTLRWKQEEVNTFILAAIKKHYRKEPSV